MKNYLLVFCLSMLMIGAVNAQKTLPNIQIEGLDGKTILASDFENDDKPTILSFWATWCKPCLSEMDAINDVYEDWQEETGVKLIAISIDDARSYAKVKTIVSGKDWPFEIYFDKNQDLKRAMNVINIPHTFLLNGNGEIIWQKNSYVPGSEDELYEEIINAINQ